MQKNSKTRRKRKKNKYTTSADGKTMFGSLSGGLVFSFDTADYEKIKTKTWYPNKLEGRPGSVYAAYNKGISLHLFLLKPPKGFEVDHIDLNPLNNCRSNLRICTHQQNQCNQPPQRNNTSGVTGVSYYSPRKKYRARTKATQYDLHLGYYEKFVEAVQARNEAMKLMFGEYGRLNDVPKTPNWIKKIVYEKCRKHLDKAVV